MNLFGPFGASAPWMTPPFNPAASPVGQGVPSMIPPPSGGGVMSRLNSPLSQIGLAILANSPGSGGLRGIGQGVLGYQQQQRDLASEELRRKYMEAQIARMQEGGQDNSAPIVVMGQDGKPRYVSRKDAIGQSPYMPPSGESNGPGELAIAQALNDPNTPEPVKKDLRNLLARKYPGPQSQEPLIAIQTPDGRSILVPRSQAAGSTPAAPRENFTPQEGERKAAALGTRLEGAMRSLEELERKDPNSSSPTLLERGAGVLGETAANAVRSSSRQQANAAQLDALDAALTLATGAAYTREQLENLRTSYFPQLLDTEETKAAKRKKFATIVETARIAAGRAAPSIDKAMGGGQPPQAVGGIDMSAIDAELARRGAR